MTTSSPYTVLVTGDFVSRRRSAGTVTWVYERDEPTPPYLMSVQIGRYEILDLEVGQRAAIPPILCADFGYDFGRPAEIMAALQRFFGAYPFKEYAVVIADDDLDDPIEAQGMAVFGRNHVDGRRTHERLVAHELAHQWFGNSLTVADWRQTKGSRRAPRPRRLRRRPPGRQSRCLGRRPRPRPRDLLTSGAGSPPRCWRSPG